MPRIRTIKPEFFKHEDLFDLERETGMPMRVAFAGLWTCCDREGRFKWKPRQLKSDILPHDDIDFSRVLDALWTRGFVKKYRVDCNEYGYVPSWHTHQVINNRESKSLLPAPSETFSLQCVDASATRDERDIHPCPTPLKHAQAERKGKEHGKEEEPKPSARKTRGVNNTQAAKASGETRHARLQQIVTGFYQEWAGAECPWDGGEGRNLKRMLDSTPNWPDTQFVTCLDNLAASECVPKGSRPRDWLEQLPRFLRGPLDRYWKPKQGNGNGNGDRKTAAAARTARNLEVLLPQRMGHGVPAVHVPDVGAVQPRADGSGERTHGRVTDGETVARKPPIIDAAPNS